MTKNKMTRKKHFPHPKEVTDKQPIAWRSTDDIIEIANSKNGWSYTSLSPTAKEWVVGHALTLGWKAVYFPLAYPNKTLSAGAVFVK